MNKSRFFYTTVDKEVLKLLTYFRKTIDKEFGNDTENPERVIRIFTLTLAHFQLVGCSNTRKELSVLDSIEKSLLKKERSKTHCNQCKKMVSVTVMGEAPTGELNLKRDKAKCSVCGDEFFNFLPNNKDDQYIMAVELVKRIPRFIKKEEKNPHGKALVEMGKSQLIAMKNLIEGITLYRKELKKNTAYLLEYERSINEIHDFLVESKKNGMYWPDFLSLLQGKDYPNLDFDKLSVLENKTPMYDVEFSIETKKQKIKGVKINTAKGLKRVYLN
jgi:hypothetical protein